MSEVRGFAIQVAWALKRACMYRNYACVKTFLLTQYWSTMSKETMLSLVREILPDPLLKYYVYKNYFEFSVEAFLLTQYWSTKSKEIMVCWVWRRDFPPDPILKSSMSKEILLHSGSPCPLQIQKALKLHTGVEAHWDVARIQHNLILCTETSSQLGSLPIS